ncbi:glycosyltransferase family 2 protein [Microcystis elabens FACHB-917]|nr:glycosyltransferase family 2 protein [Microcystis elabens FACHB-917]
MQILIPISGYSAFFLKEDFYFPKPLIEVAGTAMIEVVVRQLQRQFKDASFIFVIDPDDARSFSLDRTLRLLAGEDARIFEKAGPTSGALCSCLLAIDTLDINKPLIITNSDQVIEDDLAQVVEIFSANDCSAGVITFESIHPRWSYIAGDEQGEVIQTFEKKVASRNAIAGFYYFSTASTFIEAAKRVILNDAQVDGMYFISSSLNEIILEGGKVLHLPIASHAYHSFYKPGMIADFEKSTYAKEIREGMLARKAVNVVIPAAGEGSRFANAGWKKPKPFIDVNGQLMLEHVINNVTPTDATVTILLRQQHLDAYPKIAYRLQESGHRIISVSRLTEGTASTVLMARRTFDNDQPMIVANSDQLVDFNINDFIEDCIQRELDGSILVFRDLSMDPKWSFARVDEAGLVIEVAEKKPISDLATVGIYLFAKGKDFVGAALDMMVANDRVNNEFYTCPVYNYMIRNGARIGVFEVPMGAMVGLGTPDDLSQFLQQCSAPPSLDSPD